MSLDYSFPNTHCVFCCFFSEIVSHVREVKVNSGNSLYSLKSQGKVREFSEKSGKGQEISVKLRNLILGTAN